MPKYLALKPDLSDPGARLRIELEDDEDMAMLVEEYVLPERVLVPHPVRSNRLSHIWLRPDDIRWLIKSLTELLQQMPVEETID